MCAIIGYHNPTPELADLEPLVRLFRESQIRGLHAFGFTYVSNEGEQITVKSEKILEALEEAWPFTHLIGHCRYSTSGDWHEPRNNQPIVLGLSSLVFNGVISMKTVPEMEEEFGIKMETENDGEIALRYFDVTGFDAANWIKNATFSFAGLYLHDKKMWAIRNAQRPMWSEKSESGAIYIGSTRDIFLRAGFTRPTSVDAGKIWRVG